MSDYVISPSLLECFSAIYAESIFLNKPLFVSDYPFSKSICKNAALYFDPYSLDSFYDTFCMYVNNKHIQQEMSKEQQIMSKDFSSSLVRTKSYLSLFK